MKNILVVVLLVSLSGNLFADSFRCGRKLVKTGESSNALIKKMRATVKKAQKQ